MQPQKRKGRTMKRDVRSSSPAGGFTFQVSRVMQMSEQ
jgi:hypothetical protein